MVIEGGSHTRFGSYNTSPNPQQPSDIPADITREEQQAHILSATVGFLDGLQGKTGESDDGTCTCITSQEYMLQAPAPGT